MDKEQGNKMHIGQLRSRKKIMKPPTLSKLQFYRQMIKSRKNSAAKNGNLSLKKRKQELLEEEGERPLNKESQPLESNGQESDLQSKSLNMDYHMDVESEVNEEVDKNEDAAKQSGGELTFCKILKPTFELDAIYTGGKIEIGESEKNLYAICNFTISVYSFEQKKVIHTIKQENEEIGNFGVAPDEKTIVYFTKNNLLRHVNISDNYQLRIWKLHSMYATAIKIDRTGVLLAIGTMNGIIQVYDLRKGHITHNFTNNRGPIQSLQFHPNPQKLLLISSSEDLTMKLYDLVASSCVTTFQGFDATISSFALTNKGMSLISSSYDRFIRLFDLKSMKKIAQISTDEEIHSIETLTFKKKDGNVISLLIMGGDSGILKTLDLSDSAASIIEHAYIPYQTIRNIMYI